VLAEEFRRSNGDIRSVMRVLFLSDFFRADGVRYARVKSPAELVAGTARLAGSRNHLHPEWSIITLSQDTNVMGQQILNPPSVEGWHTGREWIDTGTLVERVNTAAVEIGDINQPGVQAIISRIKARGQSLAPRDFVTACLDETGSLTVSDSTFEQLAGHAESQGDLRFDQTDLVSSSEQRITNMLQLILATREYQMA
jgi:uncharacterized protein (DUF1800 family)